MNESSARDGRRQARSRRHKSNNTSPFDKKYFALLQALNHASKEQRIALLRTADKKLIKHICECALNVLNGVILLKKSEKTKLKKYKTILRKLAAKTKRSNGWKHKKKIIVQKGGNFLAYLLSPILDFF